MGTTIEIIFTPVVVVITCELLGFPIGRPHNPAIKIILRGMSSQCRS